MSATTKTRKARAVRTPEQKRAEAEALHQTLVDGVEALRNSDTWAAYLRFMAGFHRYSFANTMLIFTQRPDATQVAGYGAWRTKGRQVRKGEKGLRIYAPGRVIVKDDNGQPVLDDNGQPKRKTIFFPVSVFDIAQTDVMEGHEDVAAAVAQRLTGEDEHGILDRVVAYLRGTGVAVEFAPISSGANGVTIPGAPVRVVIAPNAPAQQAKTALHEAAHIALGHVEDISEYVAHRGTFEVEAESVAYVAAGLLGLDSGSYSTGYVASWAQGADAGVLRTTAERVLAAVRVLVDALDLAPAEAEEAPEDAAPVAPVVGAGELVAA